MTPDVTSARLLGEAAPAALAAVPGARAPAQEAVPEAPAAAPAAPAAVLNDKATEGDVEEATAARPTAPTKKVGTQLSGAS